LAPKSLERYQHHVATLTVEFGQRLVCDVTADDVLRLRSKRISEGLAPRTVNYEIAALRGILKSKGFWGGVLDELERRGIKKLPERHDVGRAINPGAVEGQIQGGFVQGAGYALTEEMVWDGGRLANPTLMDYKIPSSRDVPFEIDVIIVEVPDPTHPFGAKGIGEPPLIGAAAAIPNAIAAAAGTRVRRLPVTPERMLRALRFGEDGVQV